MKLKKIRQLIIKHYSRHGVDIDLIPLEIIGDNECIIFQIKLKPGTRENLIFDRASDIKTALQIQLFQPFKSGLKVCLAVSEKSVTQNSLWKMLTSQTFRRSKMLLPIALGYDMRCKMVFADLSEMPHVMYAGASNSGKSTGLICLILSLLYKNPAQKVNIILFDVVSDTMDSFEGVPQLSYPIIKDTATGVYVIRMVVKEMERRSQLDRKELLKQPAIICVIDEYLSFLLNISERKVVQEVEDSISNLLRCGRHAKIHMVLSTQNAAKKSMRVDINNISARVAFACAKYQDSITIIGEGGAEKLQGKGSLLYKSKEYPDPIQLQGAFMDSANVVQLVDRIKASNHDLSRKFVIPELEMEDPLMQELEIISSVSVKEKELADIIMWTLMHKTISVSQIKEHFSMGNRANEIMDVLCRMNIVTTKFSNQPRKVIPNSIEELTYETVNLLEHSGYTMEQIGRNFEDK
ncbi:MAG: DNA translocase FtsK [Lachnospiraceae bacterium]|nr:DNA translocase FtsK [Lachnospiraceae bacterium]